ncbi:MAG: hypothetical protein JNL26_09475 [Gemmatimonadetes bacterium]|nr:hypothetical protein [Gemmatimonadota bacterium]
MNPTRITPFVAAVLITAACSDPFQVDRERFITSAALSSAFSTVPLGYSEVSSSFSGDSDGVPSMFLPGMRAAAFGGGLMGGGLGDAFAGAMGPGRGRGHEGPFGGRFGGHLTCEGEFNAGTQRFVCDPVTRGGVTRTQSMQYKTTAGTVQQAFDTLTTNSVNVQSASTGTVSWARDDNSRGRGGPHHIGRIAGDTTTILTTTTTVNHSSNRTVTGLASPSTQRTINGTSQGSESATGTSSRGNFTATRSAADTTTGLVVPVQSGKATYPTAGTVIRTMKATVTFAGSAATSTTRREVIVYDGSTTAKVTITKDGVTQACTMALPRGRPSCP